MSTGKNTTIYISSPMNQDITRNLDAFYSFLGISGAVVPILLCIAYLSRSHRDRPRDIHITPFPGDDRILTSQIIVSAFIHQHFLGLKLEPGSYHKYSNRVRITRFHLDSLCSAGPHIFEDVATKRYDPAFKVSVLQI
jgi:hypothetical protein